MNYLQHVVYQALLKNSQLDESYAREFAEERVSGPVDLLHLDWTNIDLVAAELGCTTEEIDAFLMVTKAIFNCGKCERTAAEDRTYYAALKS